MRPFVFAARNRREILRDPLNLTFGIGFPVLVLLLISAIQANIPADLFRIGHLAPGIAVFGLSFIALFSGTLIAKDRTTSFLLRLFNSPLSASDFILGYTLPLIPMAVAQVATCFIVAFFLGLPIDVNALFALIVLLPAVLLFISIGLLAGTVFTDKQVGAICGALLTNATAWLSGTWFDLDLVGETFLRIAYCLPFAHAVDAARAAMAGDHVAILPHLVWVIGYAAGVAAIAVVVFRRRMTSDWV